MTLFPAHFHTHVAAHCLKGVQQSVLNSPCHSLKPKESENSVLSFQMELCFYVWGAEKKTTLTSHSGKR